MCGFLHTQSPIIVPLWCYRAQSGRRHLPCATSPNSSLLAPRAVASSLCRLRTTCNTVLGGGPTHVLQTFLDCCYATWIGPSNPCPLLSPTDMMTVLPWVKLSQMRVRNSLHKCDHSSCSIYRSLPYPSHWWQWVRTRGAIHMERYRILEMFRLQPEEFKKRHSWKICYLYLCNKFPNDKFNMTLQ